MNAFLREKNGYFHMVFPYQDADGKWHKKSESTKLKVKGNKRRAEAMLAARLEELGFGNVSIWKRRNINKDG